MVIQKNDLLFLSYLRGIPNPHSGGPNHVIYDFITSSPKKLAIDFLSHGAFINSLDITNIKDHQKHFIGIKRFTEGLYYENSLFRIIVSNDFYKPIHFIMHDEFFRKHMPAKKYSIIHSFDSVCLSFTEHFKQSKKIMSIHSVYLLSLELTSLIKNDQIRKYLMNRIRIREKKAFELCDILTFASKAVMNNYLAEFGEEQKKKVRIIYNGVDLDRIKKIPSKVHSGILNNSSRKKDLVILSVATHEQTKRLDIALEVVRKLVYKHNKNVNFINVGVGNQTSYLKRLTKQYEIQKNVEFLGAIPNQEVISLMKSCDILLQVSERVVFDLVILEAMACGLCVIASKDGGNAEIITDDFNGYLLDKMEPDFIANKIINSDRERISKNAYSTIEKYSTSVMAKEYLNLYKEII